MFFVEDPLPLINYWQKSLIKAVGEYWKNSSKSILLIILPRYLHQNTKDIIFTQKNGKFPWQYKGLVFIIILIYIGCWCCSVLLEYKSLFLPRLQLIEACWWLFHFDLSPNIWWHLRISKVVINILVITMIIMIIIKSCRWWSSWG